MDRQVVVDMIEGVGLLRRGLPQLWFEGSPCVDRASRVALVSRGTALGSVVFLRFEMRVGIRMMDRNNGKVDDSYNLNSRKETVYHARLCTVQPTHRDLC